TCLKEDWHGVPPKQGYGLDSSESLGRRDGPSADCPEAANQEEKLEPAGETPGVADKSQRGVAVADGHARGEMERAEVDSRRIACEMPGRLQQWPAIADLPDDERRFEDGPDRYT